MSAVVIPLARHAKARRPESPYDFLVSESMREARALLEGPALPPPDVLGSILATLERIERRLNS